MTFTTTTAQPPSADHFPAFVNYSTDLGDFPVAKEHPAVGFPDFLTHFSPVDIEAMVDACRQDVGWEDDDFDCSGSATTPSIFGEWIGLKLRVSFGLHCLWKSQAAAQNEAEPRRLSISCELSLYREIDGQLSVILTDEDSFPTLYDCLESEAFHHAFHQTMGHFTSRHVLQPLVEAYELSQAIGPACAPRAKSRSL